MSQQNKRMHKAILNPNEWLKPFYNLKCKIVKTGRKCTAKILLFEIYYGPH